MEQLSRAAEMDSSQTHLLTQINLADTGEAGGASVPGSFEIDAVTSSPLCVASFHLLQICKIKKTKLFFYLLFLITTTTTTAIKQ